jgi:glycosyltransferase involved in cell wall biosynthesis
MNILIVIQNPENSAPGVIAKRLINQLALQNSIELVVIGPVNKSDFKNIQNIIQVKNKRLPYRIWRFFFEEFKVIPNDYLVSFYASFLVKKKYDFILSIISLSSFGSLYLGERIAKKHSLKYGVYSFDAIPPPGWNNRTKTTSSYQYLVAKYLKHADYFATINELLLKYQLSTFNNKSNLVSDVIPFCAASDFKVFPQNNSLTFLYTGRIYGDRKITYVLGALNKLIYVYPSVKLIFVGSQISTQNIENEYPNLINKIKSIPFTNELDKYYEESTFLLDIDADIENDVFLSSKIINYLKINRIIVCETGINSPSRHLFKGIPSIIQCGHNVDELYQGMIDAISKLDLVDFSDRNEVHKFFDVKNIVNNFNNKIINMCQNQ